MPLPSSDASQEIHEYVTCSCNMTEYMLKAALESLNFWIIQISCIYELRYTLMCLRVLEGSVVKVFDSKSKGPWFEPH